MDQVTSDSGADRKQIRKELRADKELAREVFEFLLPDEKIRRPCLEFLADSIQAANQLTADRWGITLRDESVLLNCGMIEVMQILPDLIHVITEAESLPEFSPEEVEVYKTRNGSTKGFYPSVPGSVACEFDASNSFLVLPRIADSHHKLIQKAARTPFPPNRKNAHSPGVIDFLKNYLNRALPQPAYHQSASAFASDESSEQSHDEIELLALEQELISAPEGKKRFVIHLRRERNLKIVQAKKRQVLDQTGRLKCEACGFDFREKYGELGKDFCEVHHKLLLSETEEEVETTLGDLAILCSNCHRIIHRTEPLLSIEEFSGLLASRIGV